jgi:hypothetical protein
MCWAYLAKNIVKRVLQLNGYAGTKLFTNNATEKFKEFIFTAFIIPKDAATWPSTCCVSMLYSFNHLYFNASYFNYIRGEARCALLCCLCARLAWLLCSACGSLPFLLSHLSISQNNPKNDISLELIHTQTPVHLYSVHKQLKHKSIEM